MLVISLIKWWYGPGWVLTYKRLLSRLNDILSSFSIVALLKTLFSPWKQIVSESGANTSIDAKMRIMVDNLVSRMIGFFVRFFVILAALFLLLISLIYSVLEVLLWPLLPILPAAVFILAGGL